MSNETIKTIMSRRSIRKYESKPVEREKIDRIMECACAAPSANNTRPWHFIAVTNRETLNTLAETHPYGKMLFEASLAVIVCGENQRGDGSSNPWWEHDCSAAMQNVLLAATAQGLGSVWLGVQHNAALANKIRGIAGIPEDIQVLGIAAIGYGAEHQPPRSGTDKGRVHKERW